MGKDNEKCASAWKRNLGGGAYLAGLALVLAGLLPAVVFAPIVLLPLLLSGASLILGVIAFIWSVVDAMRRRPLAWLGIVLAVVAFVVRSLALRLIGWR
jgi:hypothetical protein